MVKHVCRFNKEDGELVEKAAELQGIVIGDYIAQASVEKAKHDIGKEMSE